MPTFADVQRVEKTKVENLRRKRGVELSDPKIGLAFSGGGIRSATFNLGILQWLAWAGLLTKIDYLSTVSGGGYIGGWLISWIKRAAGVREVENQLGDYENHRQPKWPRGRATGSEFSP